MKDYTIAMQRYGVSLELKPYINEALLVEDYAAGRCDAFWATAFRTRAYNPVTAAIDSLGAAIIIRNSRIDINGSYDVLHKLIQTFAAQSPKVSKLVINGAHEVTGIMPLGIAYPIVKDRSIDSISEISGKRIASFPYDKSQAFLIRKYGGIPVSVDTSNFHTLFNNGSLDMIAAPSIAYKPLELGKGIGSKGAIIRFPLMLLTYQMITNRSKFPDNFGVVSREFWASQFDRALQLVRLTDSEVPVSMWNDLDASKSFEYALKMRETRIEITQSGIYDARGLRIIKRIRCKVNPADAECLTKSEEE